MLPKLGSDRGCPRGGGGWLAQEVLSESQRGFALPLGHWTGLYTAGGLRGGGSLLLRSIGMVPRPQGREVVEEGAVLRRLVARGAMPGGPVRWGGRRARGLGPRCQGREVVEEEAVLRRLVARGATPGGPVRWVGQLVREDGEVGCVRPAVRGPRVGEAPECEGGGYGGGR